MKRQKRLTGGLITTLALVCLYPMSAQAMSVDELANLIKGGADNMPRIVDLRLNVAYQRGHIANAINVPSSMLERKRLPSLGNVVVYGDGIDDPEVSRAVDLLNAKPGISAEALVGGFSAWSERQVTVQRDKGLQSSSVRQLTYKDLQELRSRSRAILLIDLRIGDNVESISGHFPNTRVFDALTDVDAHDDESLASSAMAAMPSGNRSAFILIDDGNGISELIAAKLHAAGKKRVAMLVGGEQALLTRGISETVQQRSGE